MKKLLCSLVALLAVTFAGVAVAKTIANAQRPLPVRVTLLEKQVKRLSSRVGADESKLACLHWIGEASFGDAATQTQGYYYSLDAGATNFLTSALDLTAANETPAIYAVEIPQACALGGGKAATRHAGLFRARPTEGFREKAARWGIKP